MAFVRDLKLIVHALGFAAACAAAAAAGVYAAERPAAPAVAQEVSWFAGEAQIGSEAPLPVHLELRRSGDASSGMITTHGGTFRLEDGRGWPQVRAILRTGEALGEIVLRFAGESANGEFEFDGQTGTIRLRATTSPSRVRAESWPTSASRSRPRRVRPSTNRGGPCDAWRS